MGLVLLRSWQVELELPELRRLGISLCALLGSVRLPEAVQSKVQVVRDRLT